METTLDSIRDIKLYQYRYGYRFSVDALLLYSFVNLKRVSKIADLGAGSGIVGLLLAKKYPDAEVTLFELQDSLVRLAEKNITLNSLEDRVRVIKTDIREIKTRHSPLVTLHRMVQGVTRHCFDLIVSNPPFRGVKSGLISTGEEKAIARHEISLKLPELIDAVSYLSMAKGRFCIIYHPNRLLELIETMKKRGLEPKRLRFVHSNTSSEAKMTLLEAVNGGRSGMKVERPFYIYKKDGSYTDEMKGIYLHL
ncbi:MAG: tRNA1(Val) (adenine(37)-N6)-methyltransferase [Nitrospirae bacterium]|nr:tRNA1(Val) (adenine(37)-N6)-methyltransferase [Nitrospirota bacterium]